MLLRRPRDIKQCKESGVYFEDIFENTAKVERKIIMIVDESHSNMGTELSQEIIDIVNPKLILKISATPFKTDADETNFYAQKGRGNETAFIRYWENDQNVEYWYKNGSCGKDDFSIIYYSTIENTKKLFYPDWIVIYQNGDIGIFDTKSGNTSVQESQDTRDKLNALAEFVENLNRVSQKHYIAGIMEPHAGTWNLIEKVSVDL